MQILPSGFPQNWEKSARKNRLVSVSYNTPLREGEKSARKIRNIFFCGNFVRNFFFMTKKTSRKNHGLFCLFGSDFSVGTFLTAPF